MSVNKKKKTDKYRGSATHGGGSMKKRRGAGNRGGRGMAGSGKRADQKKPSILKEFGNSYFGKKGFKRPQKVLQRVNTINVDYLDTHLERLVSKNLVQVKDGIYEVDLVKLGFQKLLGRGNLTHKIRVKAPMISQTALEKVKKAGGEVVGKDESAN